MAAAPGPKSAHAIPSLFQVIHTLPALGNLDVNRPIVVNTPLVPANLTNAKVVAKKLKSTIGKSSTKFISSEILVDPVDSPVNPRVTNDMVESAELRLRAIEGARTLSYFFLLRPIHSSRSAAQYAPGVMEGYPILRSA